MKLQSSTDSWLKSVIFFSPFKSIYSMIITIQIFSMIWKHWNAKRKNAYSDRSSKSVSLESFGICLTEFNVMQDPFFPHFKCRPLCNNVSHEYLIKRFFTDSRHCLCLVLLYRDERLVFKLSIFQVFPLPCSFSRTFGVVLIEFFIRNWIVSFIWKIKF